jgi:YHS domain-containing protein
MRLSSFTGLLVFFLLLATAPAAQDATPWIAIEGIDPVLLVRGEERQGKLEFHADHEGFRYLFVSEASRATFLEDPAVYAVQLNGICARMGAANPFCHHAIPAGGPPGVGDPDIWAVVRERIYLFWTVDCRNAFVRAPDGYLEPPPPVLTPSEEDLRRGRALVDQAVLAAGGADRLDALTSYIATSSRTMRSFLGVQPGTATVHWGMPDRVRIRIESGPLTFLAATTPDAGFVVSALKGKGRFETDMVAAQRHRYLRRVRYHTDPLGVLTARHLPGFQAIALGPGTGDSGRLARVAVRVDDMAITLGIDAESGRIRSLSFIDRNAEGEAGERLLMFDDYRVVDGLLIPHQVSGQFNGQADAEWTWTVTAVRLNEAIDPGLFDTRK